MISFARVVAILDASVGGPEAPVGVHGAFWRGISRDDFVEKKVLGKRLVVPGVLAESNLVLALRGEAPFDGTAFNQMPSGGRPPVSEADIVAIEQWIEGGCPAEGEGGGQEPPAPPQPPAHEGPGYVAHPILPSTLGGPRKVYRIHPALGVARLGNSESGWFLGPEATGTNFVPPGGKYRDEADNIKRQGVRFRIYEYSLPAPGSRRPPQVREITSDEAEIVWHVQLANNKTFTRDPQVGDRVSLPMEPGQHSVSGKDQSVEVTYQQFNFPLTLGTLKTDDQGRLIVLGGHGAIDTSTQVPEDGLFWPDWCDDVADGPVRATLKLATGESPAVQSAWVVTAVPGFAAPIENIVTLYDLALDMAVRHLGHPAPQYVSFSRDIYPLLQRVVRLKWVSASARSGHGPGKGGDFLQPHILQALADNDRTPGSVARHMREAVFSRITPPGDIYSADMPALNFLTLTAYQYACFAKWASGDFLSDWQGPPPAVDFDRLPVELQPESLDQAQLMAACGGGFLPGMEVSYEVNNPNFWERPFRINTELAPGALTRALSVPWQVDFSACGWGWWPAARPNVTTTDGENWKYWVQLSEGKHLVEEWWKQGFLTNKVIDGREMVVETERIE